LLQQVGINLMVNGMQALIPITDRSWHLLIQSMVESNQAVVAVEDSRVALEAATLTRLFRPFFTTRDGGIGLSICRLIVESHGGRIWASSNNGPGVTVAFALPLKPETAA
jgi:signal transduction histidine kinase